MSQDDAHNTVELPVGTELLHGQYRILRSISRGGFGITYLAKDSLDREIVIKECFASELCQRSGPDVVTKDESRSKNFDSLRAHFKKEAYRLAALEHPGIVSVHQIFSENRTAYMAMDYCCGDDLFSVAEDTPERLSKDLLKDFLYQALITVRYTHERGFLHRDLAPDNFLLNSNDQTTLIDFGSAADVANQPTERGTRLLAVKDGYSPYEFYAANTCHTVSSDLYSLGATLHFLITGHAPVNSQSRLASVSSGECDLFEPLTESDWDLDQSFLDLVNRALALHQKNRFRSATEWLDELSSQGRSGQGHVGVTPDGGIGTKISRLVTETNEGLLRGMPKSLRFDDPVAVPTGKLSEKPAQAVDLFGNPIDDVDAYLDEQDRISKRVRPRPRPTRCDQTKPDNKGSRLRSPKDTTATL